MDRDEGKWRLLNPLSIRFSQSRIAPQFRDGHVCEDVSAEVYESPLDVGSDAQDTASAPSDSASGPPTYDTILVPPFPAIRVISWRPKLRNKDGEARRDEYGDLALGQRNWFALDNRRLFSMQRAAAKRWPRRCCVVVRCIEEVPGTSTIRELRKFRTTTEGRSVDVGFHFGDSKPWSWVRDAPATAASSQDEVEPEGFFAEDLWDAQLWAPHVVAAARRKAAEGAEGGAEAAAGGEEEEVTPAVDAGHRARGGYAGGYNGGYNGGYHGGYNGGRQCMLVACPIVGWQYMDPSGKVQGPFELVKMRQWHQHGFFYPALPMRCDSSDEFVPFAQLWPLGVPPFTSRVIRYRC